jgi:hypothetical protein
VKLQDNARIRKSHGSSHIAHHPSLFAAFPTGIASGLTCRMGRSYTSPAMDVTRPLRGTLPLLGLLCLAVIGCASKTLQYPEDHERYLRIDKAVESLRKAYIGKDASGLGSLMVPMDATDRLRQDAESDFETFHDIAMEFRIERIMIDNDDIDVYVHWSGLWKQDPEDPGMRHRGHSRLQWVGTTSILLVGVQGDIPFGAKGRQALTTQSPRSGKK